MAAAKKHKRHKYYYVDGVWACGLPDCTHFMPHNVEKLVNNRGSYCWSCNAEMTLNPSNMKENKPRCDSCTLGITEEAEEAPISPSLAAFLNGDK
jgi:hypothetical protein